MSNANEVLSTKEAAEFLRISVRTLSELVSKKEVPYTKVSNRNVFLRSKLLKWLDDNTEETTEDIERGATAA